MIVSNEFPLGKKILIISLVTKILKKLDYYAHSIHKWLCIKKNDVTDDKKYSKKYLTLLQ